MIVIDLPGSLSGAARATAPSRKITQRMSFIADREQRRYTLRGEFESSGCGMSKEELIDREEEIVPLI
jgi:hypothetical protein